MDTMNTDVRRALIETARQSRHRAHLTVETARARVEQTAHVVSASRMMRQETWLTRQTIKGLAVNRAYPLVSAAPAASAAPDALFILIATRINRATNRATNSGISRATAAPVVERVQGYADYDTHYDTPYDALIALTRSNTVEDWKQAILVWLAGHEGNRCSLLTLMSAAKLQSRATNHPFNDALDALLYEGACCGATYPVTQSE